MNKLIFPTILIVCDLCAAAVYFCCKDVKHGIYWVAAAVLTMTVTF